MPKVKRKPGTLANRGKGERRIKEAKDLAQLTLQQQTFLFELVCDPKFNQTEAARKAGYLDPEQMGSKLLNHPFVALALQRFQKSRVERAKITSDRILQEVDTIALMDVVDMVAGDGKVIVDDLRSLPERIRRCIQSFKIKEIFNRDGDTVGRIIELKFWDKMKALELSMRHRGMLNDKVRVEGTINVDWDRVLTSNEGKNDPNVIDVTPENMQRIAEQELGEYEEPSAPIFSAHPSHDPVAKGNAKYDVGELLEENEE